MFICSFKHKMYLLVHERYVIEQYDRNVELVVNYSLLQSYVSVK